MPHKIGFLNEPFPIKEGSGFDQETFTLKCRGFTVDVEVYQCKLLLDGIEFTGVATSTIDVSSKLALGGWGSHCYIDEADTMREAVELYAAKRNKVIGNEYNNWPSFRGHLSDQP